MNKEMKQLLKELAEALDAASATARKLAEMEPVSVTMELDAGTFSQALCKANHDNPEA